MPFEKAKYISRKQVAKILGCSTMHVSRLGQEGKLKEYRERPNGYSYIWYDPAEVEAFSKIWVRQRVPRRRTREQIIDQNIRGKVSARVFKAFEDMLRSGRARDVDQLMRAVVIETEADPVLVRELWTEFNLGISKAEALAREEKEERLMRARQREYDREKRQEIYRNWRLELAKADAAKILAQRKP